MSPNSSRLPSHESKKKSEASLIPRPQITTVWDWDHLAYSSLVYSSPCWRGPWWQCPGCWDSCWCSSFLSVSPPLTLTGRGAPTRPGQSGLVCLCQDMQINTYVVSQVLLLRSSQHSNPSFLKSIRCSDQLRIEWCLWMDSSSAWMQELQWVSWWRPSFQTLTGSQRSFPQHLNYNIFHHIQVSCKLVS